MLFAVAATFMVLNFLKRQVLGSMTNNLQISAEEYELNKLEIAKTKLMPLLKIGTSFTAKDFDIEQLFSLEFEFVHFPEVPMSKSYFELRAKFIKCSNLSDDLLQKYYIDKNLFHVLGYYCVDLAKLEKDLLKIYQDNNYQLAPPLKISHFWRDSMFIKIYPCNPDQNSKCGKVTEAQRDEALKNHDFSIALASFSTLVNLEDYANPLKFRGVRVEKVLDLRKDSSIHVNSSILPTYIKDEFDFPFSSNTSGTFSSDVKSVRENKNKNIPLSCTDNFRQLFDCPFYYENRINVNERDDVIKINRIERKFKTLSELVSSIGGLYSGIWLGITLFYSLLFEGIGNQKITEKIFGLKESISCMYKKTLRLKSKGIDGKRYLVSPRVFKAARTVIDETLDVYSLVQQLTLLKMLLCFAFNDRPQTSGPSSALQLKLAEKTDADEKDDQDQSSSFEQKDDQDTNPSPHDNIFFKENPFEYKEPPNNLSNDESSPNKTQEQTKENPIIKLMQVDSGNPDLRELFQIAISNYQSELFTEGEAVFEKDANPPPTVMSLNDLNMKFL